eukprot:4657884-Prymnesium_polylepis.1
MPSQQAARAAGHRARYMPASRQQPRHHQPINVLPEQLVEPLAARRTVAALRQRFSDGGLLLRVWECSLDCSNDGRPEDAGEAGLVRWENLMRERVSKKCVVEEMERRMRPASFLRWDVPAALFNAGRCASPSAKEKTLFPDASSAEIDGYNSRGFIGHNVTSMGLGWIFHDLARSKRGGAFGHDAWTSRYRKSGTHAGTLERCGSERTSAGYASARADARGHRQREGYAFAHEGGAAPSRGAKPFPLGSPRHRAAAYKWGFANSSWNCYHKEWEAALADQRAYATLTAQRQQELAWNEAECSIWGSLYNQMHASWNASDLQAIFYVNDTLTASRSSEPLVLGAAARQLAMRGYRDALLVQHTVANTTHGRLLLPVVQVQQSTCARLARPLRARAKTPRSTALTPSTPFWQVRITSECFDGRPLASRLAMEGGEPTRRRLVADAASAFFALPAIESDRAWP